MSTSRKIISNSAYYAIGRIWMIGVNLVLTPLILSYLGTEQFAVWALFWAFSTYFIFMDMGLGVSLTRDVAMSSSELETVYVNEAFNTVLVFFCMLGAVCLLLAWVLTPWLLEVLHVSKDMSGTVLNMAHWGVLVFVLIGIVQTLTSFMYGFQRFDLVNKATLIVSVPNVLGAYLVLQAGLGILGLLWLMVVVYALKVLLLAIWARRVFPEFEFGFHYVSWRHFRTMLPLGVRVQVSRFADLASFQADKILLALLVPVSFVTMYDLGAKVAMLIRDLPYALTSPVFPAASEMHGRQDFEQLWLLYDRGSKYLLVATLPMLFGMWLTAPLVIGLWLGYVSPLVYQAVLLLSFAYWVIISVAMVFSVSTAIGWAKPIMQSALLQAFGNISLSFVLIMKFGFSGALYGTVIAITLANTILYFRFCRHFDRSVRNEWRRFWHVARANIAPVLCCLPYIGWVDTVLTEGDRLQSLMYLLGAVLIYVAAYAVSIRLLGLFDKTDERLLGGYFPAIRWFVAHGKPAGGGCA
ncbi:MAG TPA: oligosaccharide flippase family protein [Mariprofundaceae bacterium]|nr:oligosaccharide flippase family protein [Mariprofundaceae bacterium]